MLILHFRFRMNGSNHQHNKNTDREIAVILSFNQCLAASESTTTTEGGGLNVGP